MTIEIENFHELPPGWVSVKLCSIAEVNPPLPFSDLRHDLEVTFLPMKAVEEETGRFDPSMTVTYEKVKKGYTSFINGDIIFAKITPCMENGKVAVVDNLRNGVGFGSTEFHVIRLRDSNVSAGFYFYYLVQENFRIGAKKNMTGSAGQLRVPTRYIEEVEVPFPPSAEQHRIVAKLEELLTLLDAGVESLGEVKKQLKRYRQAVLKYAFEGKLTEEWRKTHKRLIEPAIELLEQIRQQRKEKVGKKSKELPPADLSDLPALPEGWKWIRLGDIAERMQYGTSEKASKEPSGIPVLRMGNIQEGSLVFDNLKHFPEDWSRLSEFLLSDGDVLFNRTNSAELVGKTAVYREYHPKATFASYLIRVQTSKTVYMPELLSFFINSLYGRKYISSVVSQQVGQANVNGTKLSLMPIPFIPYQEQIVIQQEIERCFSVADELGKSTGQTLRQADLLRQSILKMAFEGKLVSQDPTDEPADQLLARIKGVKIGNENTDENKPKELGLMRYVK